jgi:hypothetical protein
MAALTLLAFAAGAVHAPATDFSYIKKGTFSGKGKTESFSGTNADGQVQTFPESTFSASFRVTSVKAKGPRYMRSFKLGPLVLNCTNTTSVPTRYKQVPLPQLGGFPAVSIPNGFLIRSFVLRGGKWTAGKSAVSYNGSLPHVDVGLVYSRQGTKFTPNPLASPSVTYKVRVDDLNRQTTAGPWTCLTSAPVTFRKS